MSVLTVIKKVGEKIISIVSYPFKHSHMLAALFAEVRADYPSTKTVLVGLIQRAEAMGPEVLAAIAAKGFDVPDDIKVAVDLKGLFGYIHTEVMPVIEKDYADISAALHVPADSVSIVSAPASAPAPVPVQPSEVGPHPASESVNLPA